MSQSGRLTLNQPVPGAGIQTITGNAGGPVPGNGAANVILQGAGLITVTGNPGANTLTITSAGVPAHYPTDNLIANPDGFGSLNIVGGPNINTDALVANTVTINLNDNVVIPGFFEADGDITSDNGDIVASNGNILAVVGNIEAGNAIIGHGGGTFNDQVVITANGIESTGPTVLVDLNRGVVQANAAHTLFSNEGLDGQILIGSTVGPAAWANITAGARITVVNTPNGIQINAAPQLPSGFHTDNGNSVPVAGILNILGGLNIYTTGGGNTVSVALQGDIAVDRVTTNATAIFDPAIITAVGSGIESGLDITAARDITAGRNLTAGHDLKVNDTANTTLLYVANTTTLNAERNGVLQTNGAGLVQATNGNPPGQNGQVLISGPVVPAWTFLTAGPGITIDPVSVPNHITISSTTVGFGSTAFKAIMINDYNCFVAVQTIQLGTAQGGVLDTTAAFWGFNGHPVGSYIYPGDGALVPARYTAPAAGLYNFKLSVYFNGASNVGFRMLNLGFQVNGIGFYGTGTSYNPNLVHGYGNDWFSMVATEDIFLHAGDTVETYIAVATSGILPTLFSTTPVSGYPACTYFSGVRIG